jgi:hypothetical protein
MPACSVCHTRNTRNCTAACLPLHHITLVHDAAAACRIYALELLSLLLQLMQEGQLQQTLLPEPPLALAPPLQRIFLSSEARKSKHLRAALLGVLGQLLQLSNNFPASTSSSGGFPASGRSAATPADARSGGSQAAAGFSRLQGVEPLSRHWLLEMCRGELQGPDGRLSAAEANQGAIEGMTAALALMEVSAMLLTCDSSLPSIGCTSVHVITVADAASAVMVFCAQGQHCCVQQTPDISASCQCTTALLCSLTVCWVRPTYVAPAAAGGGGPCCCAAW